VKARLKKKLVKKALQRVIDCAFDRYIEHIVDRLIELGLDSNAALATVFTSADFVTEQGDLPVFPDDQSTQRERGEWLVAAVDNGFLDFVIEAVSGVEGEVARA
jgi:hypothetical protein